MREISKELLKLLVTTKTIRNTGRGYVDQNGRLVTVCATKNKRFIEDKYVDIAENLKK